MLRLSASQTLEVLFVESPAGIFAICAMRFELKPLLVRIVERADVRILVIATLRTTDQSFRIKLRKQRIRNLNEIVHDASKENIGKQLRAGDMRFIMRFHDYLNKALKCSICHGKLLCEFKRFLEYGTVLFITCIN